MEFEQLQALEGVEVERFVVAVKVETLGAGQHGSARFMTECTEPVV